MKNTVIGKNSQEMLFLQGLLAGIKTGEDQQNKPFTIGVTEKHEGIKADLEIYPNCNDFLAYRFITSAGCGLWQTWEQPEEIENTFRMMSLL